MLHLKISSEAIFLTPSLVDSLNYRILPLTNRQVVLMGLTYVMCLCILSLQAFSQIDELLRRMPVFSTFSRQSLAEFELKWRHWQEQCKQSLEDRTFMSYPQLETICKVRWKLRLYK